MSLWGTFLEDLLDLSFNGKSLQDITGAQITDHNFDEMPEIRSFQNAISSAHRSITTGQYFITKRAWVKIAVQGEFYELQAILARFRQLVQYRNRELVLKRGVPVLEDGQYVLDETVDVTYRAANIVAIDPNHNAAKGTEITIEFTIDDPVGIGGTPQTLFDVTGRTGASYSFDLSTIDVQGTFLEQYPVYTIKVNSVTNGDNPHITIENGLNKIKIAQPFTAGDILVVDTDPDTMGVRLNDEIIDFTGGIPFMADPESMVYVTNGFTARNLDIKATIKPRYI